MYDGLSANFYNLPCVSFVSVCRFIISYSSLSVLLLLLKLVQRGNF